MMSEKINDGGRLPKGCPEYGFWCDRLNVLDANEEQMRRYETVKVEIHPVGTSSRLSALEARCGELEAALKRAEGLISASVLGYILGRKPTPGAEAHVNSVVDQCHRALLTGGEQKGAHAAPSSNSRKEGEG